MMDEKAGTRIHELVDRNYDLNDVVLILMEHINEWNNDANRPLEKNLGIAEAVKRFDAWDDEEFFEEVKRHMEE
jgi:hypothetical protein